MKKTLKYLIIVILIGITVVNIRYRLVLHENIPYIVSRHHDTQYSEKLLEKSNVIVIVSNQSFNKPVIKLNGFIDEVKLFEDRFYAENQHQVTNYYKYVSAGKHSFSISTEDDINEKVEISLEDNRKVFIYVFYWYESEGSVDIKISNEMIKMD